jgi:hypothetical protein
MWSATELEALYEITEEARVLLREAGYERDCPARRAVGEAAYYLSDTLDPDRRASLLMAAEADLEVARDTAPEHHVADALVLLNDAGRELEEMLRTSETGSSELRIALRALRCAIAELAREVGLRRGQRSLRGLHSRRLMELRGPYLGG